jgi:hypothetical protein
MALTATHQPTGTTYQPGYNDNIYVLTESDAGIYGQYNFKFICDVKDGSGNLITRLKAPIYYGSTNQGVFNISRLIENYVTHDWSFDDATGVNCLNSVFGYQAVFGYEYSTGATTSIIQSTGVTSVVGTTIWNGSLSPLDFLSYDEDNYFMSLANASTASFLTNNQTKRLPIDAKAWLYFLHGSNVATVDVAFSPSGSTSISVPSGTLARVPIGSNIPGGIPVGTTALVCTPKNSSGTQVGKAYIITIDTRCSKYPTTDLYFLNRLGGIDTMRFDMLKRTNFDIERRTYKSNPFTLNGTYSYDTSAHSNSDFFTQANERLTLNSNLITEAEAEWLKELLMSPRVWMYDGTLKAVNIQTSQYEQKTHVVDKAFNLTLEVTTSIPDKSQRL